MAFSFGNAGAFGALQQQQSVPQGQVQNGQDLPEITTEALGFLAIAGEAKVQLLPTPWPKDNLPPSTANLLSIASRRGLAAAAGPESVIVARTESIRKAFSRERTGDGQIRAFQPEMTLPLGMRVSQVAFTADENYLVLSAEQGGGLAVYEVDNILKGNMESAFQMPTGGQNLRALVPNPTPDMGSILALATLDGKLMVADLKERNFAKVNNSEALTENVSCISWSARGKQLVAGLADGSASQLTPQGVLKAQIPRPPSLDANHHVSSITWLENDVFLMVHNPSNSDDHPPQSTFHLVTRSKGTQQYMYQKLSDPSPNFGLDRSPPHHFMLRLRDFPPALSDVLIVASTASTDIGLFTKSATPLTSDKPSNEITNVFTLTEMADDSRRATLPVNEDLADTSPIGAALDLSSNERVARPIPGDEMEQSKTPLPGLMVLNNEGVLSSWWIAYYDSLRRGTVYPGLAAAGNVQAPTATPTSAGAFGQSAFGASTSSTNAFGGSIGGGSAFGAPSALAKPSPWGAAPATTSAFGASASTTTAAPKPAGGAFGAPAFGAPAAPAFGAPAFGSPSAPAPGKPAFGATGFGQRASPWAAGTTAAATPAFGQSGLGGVAAAPKPAASFGSAAPASGGFASFASKPGFAGVAASSGGESIFGKPAAGGSAFGSTAPSTSAFGSTPSTGSAFGGGAPATGSAFGSTAPTTSAFGSTPSTGSAFGAAAPSISAFSSGGAFKLGSTFTADPNAKNDNEKPDPTGSMFGGGFGKVLGEVKEAHSVPSPEANMDDEPAEPETKPEAPAPTNVFGKPAAPAAQTSSLFGAKLAESAAPTSSLFGAKPAAPTTGLFDARPAEPAAAPVKAGFSFGAPAAAPAAAEAKSSLFGNMNKTTPAFGSAFGAPKEEKKTTPPPASMPEAPLPPDPSSKPLFGVGESSASSQLNDAPLPPDFTKAKPKVESDDAPLPPDFIKVKPKAEFDDAPLPPDFAPSKPVEKKAEEPKIKQEESSSPVILPAAGNDDDVSEGFSEEEPGHWSESDDDGEHEGEEDDEEESATPKEDKSHTPEDSPEQQSLFSKRSKPTGRQLFGEINNSQPTFGAPQQREALRSPSPARSALPPHMRGRPDVNRSVSAPMAASQILGNRAPPSKPEFKETLQHQEEEVERRARAAKQKEIDEAQALVDEDDERTQEYLNMEIAPTLRLDEFVAHQDYVHDPTQDSVPYQVEALFRDINAMIDTLGMNSRSMQAFIRGHSELYPDSDRTREDLEKDDEWCMDEIERLDKIIEFDLRETLDEGRIHDVEKKVRICQELGKEALKLRQRKDELQALLSTTLDPEHAALARTAPLNAEQATHQHELRASFAKLQKQIAEVEEALVLLRTKLASRAGVNGKSAPGPTVEAVIRTVAKMTAMAEKRSGDIDVLENQMRRLRFSSVASDRDRTPTRDMSPFNSPLKQSFRNSVAYERRYTPERRMPGNFRDSFSASMRSSRGFDPSASMRSDRTFNPSANMRSSDGFDPRASMRSDRSYGTPQRKKLDGFTKDDQNKIKNRVEKRREVTGMVQKALEKRGARVYPMD